MKKLSRKEMKKVKGGDAPVVHETCETRCYSGAPLCSNNMFCYTGPGTYETKCC